MRLLRLLATLTLPTAVLASPAHAQERAEAGAAARGGGAELPLKPSRNVRFTTDEGTWMSLDVSPDGRTVVFDLVGDIYTVPIGGGKATRITDGMAMDARRTADRLRQRSGRLGRRLGDRRHRQESAADHEDRSHAVSVPGVDAR